MMMAAINRVELWLKMLVILKTDFIVGGNS